MIEVVPARTDEDYEVYAAIERRIFPGAPTLEEFRHREATWAAYHPLAYLDGEAAGTGWTGVFAGAEEDRT